MFLHKSAEFIELQLHDVAPKTAKIAVKVLPFLPATIREAVGRIVAALPCAVHVGAGDISGLFGRVGASSLRPKLGQTFANLGLTKVQLCT